MTSSASLQKFIHSPAFTHSPSFDSTSFAFYGVLHRCQSRGMRLLWTLGDMLHERLLWTLLR